MLYSRLELTCRERRLSQVALLRDKARRLKAHFNTRVQQTAEAKRNELDRIEEKNGRLQEILEELPPGAEGIERYGLAASEEEGAGLEVRDEEVTVERYLSAAERLAQARAAAEEEARQAASAKDDQVARALSDMMYGTLETKKEAAGVGEIEAPPWLEQPPESWSEEQAKAVKEYERRVAAAEEERDKHRRALETEAKKVRADIQAILEGFNETLLALAEDRLQVEAQVLEVEVEVTLLLDAVVRDHDSTDVIRALLQMVDSAEVELNAANSAVESVRAEVDLFREEYEVLLNEDKAMEKTARRDTADSPDQEVLLKLFKQRPRPDRKSVV